MESIFHRLDHWANRNPGKLLYSFLDLRGRQTEWYSYETFLHRTQVIAGHLRAEYRFGAGERLLLAYPPGLEMICAFFACARAGLIPVPVYPPSSHGFQAAFYKMVRIAKDCQAAAVLTSRDYHRSIATNLVSPSISASLNTEYFSSLNWIVTEELKEPVKETALGGGGEILFLQYTSGSTGNPKGVMVTHSNILHNCDLFSDHSDPVAVSWLPQYHDMGLIGYYLFSSLMGGTTYGFSSLDFVQRPALWFETIKKYRASATSAPNFAFEYCLRQGRLSEETLKSVDLSSLKFLMTAAEPVRPTTYLRFLQKFQAYGLKPERFFVAYGLAENTLAVSNYGRNILSINKNALARRKVRVTTEVSEVALARRIVSCGKPLGDIVVKIVDPEKHIVLDDGNIGEIWIGGKSKCLGYWNNPELTQKIVHARIVGESQHGEDYLRTGDLAFLHQGELYVCGRTKDVIIIRGQNYYPQDIEDIVEGTSDLIRRGCVVAFEINEDHDSALAVVAEVKNPKAIPEARTIVAAIRNNLNLETDSIAFIAPRAVPRTSSGKLMRHSAKQMWLEGKFKVLGQFSRKSNLEGLGDSNTVLSPFVTLKARYGLKGDELCSLVEAGVDSLDLVVFMHEIKELLKERGAGLLAGQLDVGIIQQLSVAELFCLADQFLHFPEAAVLQMRNSLIRLQDEHRKSEERMMRADQKLAFEPQGPVHPFRAAAKGGVILTGGTGFVGPFLLKSLLEQTNEQIYVLVRGAEELRSKERLRTALESIGPSTVESQQVFERRVIPVCGDLAQPSLGLSASCWKHLANNVHTIYHNGAAVNYLHNYEKLRSVNVFGTNEILRLAFESLPKTFNFVSTTFIFGWAVKEALYETDSNQNMELLDFGYSQSKWVAERIVVDAASKGLRTRIFRPALVSSSVTGGGNNLDIAVRLLAFMVNHGIGVEALNQVSFVPADVAANNMVAISNAPETINGTYHVTRDNYANMVDITNIIARVTGRHFKLFKLSAFVPEVIRRCTKDDLLFPLLDFLIGSVDSIASMEFKRYDSSRYQWARDTSKHGKPDPSLEETVLGMLRFMHRKGIISVSGAGLDALPLGRSATAG